MDVYFQTNRLQKACSSEKAMKAEWGPKMAAKIALRLSQLEAADNLEIVARSGLGRFHEHKGDRQGQLSLDLVHPQRLLFQPNHDPVPRKDDGGLDLAKITSVLILEITDPH
jgi:proteic killer suppression protein